MTLFEIFYLITIWAGYLLFFLRISTSNTEGSIFKKLKKKPKPAQKASEVNINDFINAGTKVDANMVGDTEMVSQELKVKNTAVKTAQNLRKLKNQG